ncbi:MAG: hypothetical protein KDA24_01910 [Deltaproteobacteria bacterium]|nr:hypothetical protein [Deltaproteobacteria bacterium]
MAQGRFFLQSGQARQALAEFEAAALLPEGQAAAELHEQIARTRYSLGELAGAVEAAKTAAALSPRLDPEFAEFHDFLTSRFGKVLIIGGTAAGATRPAPATPLLDPELKRAFEAARQRMSELEDGSTSIYLPVGSYRVGAHIVEVVAKGVTRMDLRPSVESSGSGVYGERKSEDKARTRRPARSPAPKKASPVVAPPPPSGGLMIQTGGAGFAQQGNAGASARFLVGAQLGVANERLLLDAALLLGVTRGERLRGASGAPPAGQVGVRLEIAAAFPAGPIALGPLLAWSFAGAGAAAALLPDGYAGPAAYLVQGPELGVRIAGAKPGAAVQPVLALYAFASESSPVGARSAGDAKPHLTAGGGFDVGVRVR